jgi:hypothetical protein
MLPMDGTSSPTPPGCWWSTCPATGTNRTGARAVTVAATPVPATPPTEAITRALPGLACSCCWSAAEVICPATSTGSAASHPPARASRHSHRRPAGSVACPLGSPPARWSERSIPPTATPPSRSPLGPDEVPARTRSESSAADGPPACIGPEPPAANINSANDQGACPTGRALSHFRW